MLKKIKRKLDQMVRRFTVKRCDVPFVIWFRERSGSTHLCSLLDRHPQIICRKENFSLIDGDKADYEANEKEVVEYRGNHFRRKLIAFGKSRIINPSGDRVKRHLHEIYSMRSKACGFKFKYPIQTDLFPEITRELANLEKPLRVIVLNRANVLKLAISRQNMLRILNKTGENNLSKNEFANAKLTFPFPIDVKAVVQQATFLARSEAKFLNSADQLLAKGNAKILHIDYDELLKNQSAVISRICDFLSVDSNLEIDSGIHKATPDDIALAVENFEELQAAVSGTELEAWVK